MTDFTFEIQAGSYDTGIWQAMEPAETVDTTTDEWPGEWTAEAVAQAISDNQNIAEAPYRIVVWEGTDGANGSAEPAFILNVESTVNRDHLDPGLAAWLGPALDQLTDDQIGRFVTEVAAIDARYPDPDEQYLRNAALSATVQYLLGETTPEEIKRELMDARTAESMASAAAQQIAVMLYGDGTFEIPAAAAVGITRTTLRRALDKDS